MTDSWRGCLHADRISTHILTKRMTDSVAWSIQGRVFQLTSSRRGWQWWIRFQLLYKYFNSHPHEEDDSTESPADRIPCISTHILTKRMTYRLVEESYLWKFQLTSSRRGWQDACTRKMSRKYFNSHPHEEDDVPSIPRQVVVAISTHILTKRMTAILNKNNLFKIAYYINNKHFISIVDIFFHFHIYF